MIKAVELMAILKNTLMILIVFIGVGCSQLKNIDSKPSQMIVVKKELTKSPAPKSITRNIKRDRDGNIWFATWEGIFKHDGSVFKNITENVSLNRFFSILEDRKGNFWFGSIGAGAYFYDGETFRNFTTIDGLANNRVLDIYEDRKGYIWFATEGGASYYNGNSFTNFTSKDGLLNNDLNSIIEDGDGNVWFASRGEVSIYDGKRFSIFLKNDGLPFKNVRSLLVDKKEQIWLAGSDGLWRYDGNILTSYSSDFTGYVFQDSLGSIWTSSKNPNQEGWQIRRYEINSLFADKLSSTQIWTTKGMTFGISEDSNGDYWFGTLNGACHYDGSKVNCLGASKNN